MDVFKRRFYIFCIGTINMFSKKMKGGAKAVFAGRTEFTGVAAYSGI